jgi:dihydropteroate synthase
MTEASQIQLDRAVRSAATAPGWPPQKRPYPAVMGVLNVTPDSFSDGGKFLDPSNALAQAERMIADGADVIDVGAESNRYQPTRRSAGSARC